jgi:hypothetical protein
MSRRIYIVALVVSATVGLLLLAHQNVDKFSYGPSQSWEEPAKVVSRLEAICQLRDVFDAEYGRTNIRMTRAYEGEPLVIPC